MAFVAALVTLRTALRIRKKQSINPEDNKVPKKITHFKKMQKATTIGRRRRLKAPRRQWKNRAETRRKKKTGLEKAREEHRRRQEHKKAGTSWRPRRKTRRSRKYPEESKRSRPREKKKFKVSAVDLPTVAQLIAKTVVFTIVG